MNKEIDINNEDQILSECDFDYFYESEECSHELCMFYNDIQHQKADFNCKQAHIDLGRIAITLNNQHQKIKELETKLKDKEMQVNAYAKEIVFLDKKIESQKMLIIKQMQNSISTKCKLGSKLYMIPTLENKLKNITEYTLLNVSLSDIGIRYHLAINKKQSGAEPFYSASEDMFGTCIFATKEEAEAKLKETL